jgi:DNA-binding NarL/FixJ family response regulator
MTAPVRVGLVDDQPLIRTGLRTMLEYASDLEIVGEAENGELAVELARRQRPDVILMDIRMPVLDGIQATRRITADPDLSDVRVVMLTTFDLDEYVYAAIRAGASGFMLKDARPEDILSAVRVVAAGEALLAPSVTRRLIGVRVPTGGGAGAGARVGRTHPPRARGSRPGRPGPVERRDRRAALRQPGHGQDPREPHHDQSSTPATEPSSS